MEILAITVGAGAVLVVLGLATWVVVTVLAEVRDEEIDVSDGDRRG